MQRLKVLGKRVLVIVLICLISSTSLVVAQTTEEWKEDINYFKEKLPRKHKNLFFKISRQEFNQETDRLINNLDSLTDPEVVLSFKSILAKIDDSHTNLSLRNYINSYYPLSFKKFGKDYYVTKTTKGYEELLGAKLVAINGQQIREIKDKLARIIPAENKTKISLMTQYYLNVPQVLKFCGIVGATNNFLLEQEGERVEVSLPEFTKEEIKAADRTTINYKKSLVQQNAKKLFSYQYFEDKEMLYFQYNKCWSRELEKKYKGVVDKSLPSFKETTDKLVEILQEERVEKFVIDLRYNSGGSSRQGSRFARRLARLNPDCDIYVVIGNRTFSSAIINAVRFKKYNDALLVGEPTGGKPNHYGELGRFTLPNSKITVSYSTKYFKMMKGDSDSLYPDIRVNRSFNDFLRGTDTVLKRINKL